MFHFVDADARVGRKRCAQLRRRERWTCRGGDWRSLADARVGAASDHNRAFTLDVTKLQRFLRSMTVRTDIT